MNGNDDAGDKPDLESNEPDPNEPESIHCRKSLKKLKQKLKKRKLG